MLRVHKVYLLSLFPLQLLCRIMLGECIVHCRCMFRLAGNFSHISLHIIVRVA